VSTRTPIPSVTHRCPPGDSGVMPCCGQTPFEVSRLDRMTLLADRVTCGLSVEEMRAKGHAVEHLTSCALCSEDDVDGQ